MTLNVNRFIIGYSLILAGCATNNNLSDNNTQGQIMSPINSQEVKVSTRQKLSSIIPYNRENVTRLTLVIMDDNCNDVLNNWESLNRDKILSENLVNGIMYYQINRQHTDSDDEFVVVFNENQLSNWTIDIENFSFSGSKALLFGYKSYRFKNMLKGLFKSERVFVPCEGCNKENGYIRSQEGWNN